MKNLALCRKCEHLKVDNVTDYYSDDVEEWRSGSNPKKVQHFDCRVTKLEDEVKKSNEFGDETWWSISSFSYDNKKQYRSEEPPEECPYRMEHLVLGKRSKV